MKTLKRMLQSKKGKAPVAPTPQEGSEEKPVRSSARLDYDSKADSLARLIQIVSALPAYAPNEADLKVATLKTTLAGLIARNDEVAKATNALKNARITRDKVMYSKNGVYGTGTAVKEYIRSIEGVRSAQASAASRIKFGAKPR